MAMTKQTKQVIADRAMSKLRVAKSTLLAVEECLAEGARKLRAGELDRPAVRQCLIDAAAYVGRGMAKLEDAAGAVVQALKAGGVTPRGSLRPGRRPRKLPEVAGPKRGRRQ